MAVNLTKHQNELTNAWKTVSQDKETQNWALFAYEANTNNLTYSSSGNAGLNQLVQEFNCHQIQYALCRLIDNSNGINKLILINWQGESAPLTRKGLCASHVSDVANYFKGCSQTITLRNEDEATEEYIMEQVKKRSSRICFSPPAANLHNKSKDDSPSIMSSDHNKTINKTDIGKELAMNRKSFWEKQEEEEKERLNDEKKKITERQAQFDKERKLREEAEAKKLEETIKERERAIEATRQADKTQFVTPMTLTKENISDEDERVGRRSELLRHERSQETNSLISKGLIKNKKAMFEQACSQQQASQKASPASIHNLTRKTSGTIVSERLNAFQSLTSDGSLSPASSSNDKVSDSNQQFSSIQYANGTNVDNSVGTVSEKLDTLKIVNDEEVDRKSTVTQVFHAKEESNLDTQKLNSQEIVRKVVPTPDLSPKVVHSPKTTETLPADVNGNDTESIRDVNDSADSINYVLTKKETENGNNDGFHDKATNICAKALYDYQAADNTEISFDPDDIIGEIKKVDEGWWYGRVLTGKFVGTKGLFPSNYVVELDNSKK